MEPLRLTDVSFPRHFLPLALLACGFLAVNATAAPTSGPAEDAVPITDIPKVSGVEVQNAVADWQDQGLKISALAGESMALPPAADFQAIGRLGWTAEGLLLHVEVTDPVSFEAADLEHLFEGDSVELFLMTGDNDQAGMIQLVASPGRTGEPPAVRSKVFDYRSKEFKQDAAAFTPRVAARKTERGYVMDLLLPWSGMKIKPEAGTICKVGFAVNSTAGKEDKDRLRAIWINHLPKAEWMKLSPVRLAEKASSPAPVAAWAGYDEFKTGYANVVAEPDQTGRKVALLEAGKVLAQGTLARDGERSVAALRFPVLPIGQKHGALTLTLDDKAVRTLTLPDLNRLRRDLFLASGAQPSYRNNPPTWALVNCRPEVFTGEAFPACDFPEPARIRELVGAYTVRTDYYDADFNKVEKAVKPGRYGAVATITSAAGDTCTAYRTLYRAAAEGDVKPGAAAYLLASTPAGSDKPDEFLAAKADRDWWHALRKKLGTAIKYEYYVRLPKGYEQDPAKRWPVIFYLHGSGGGVTMEGVQQNAIQIPAREQADFPFIAVSLRSPGGWHPPAVKDVIDEVAAKYRTDPARYYLTGFSMGGMGTWMVVLDQPDRFAAIAPVGGNSGNPAQAARIKQVSVWVINGADDRTTTSTEARKMFQALKDAGAEVKWTEIPGAGHVESHDIAYRWPELYTWFLAHQRK